MASFFRTIQISAALLLLGIATLSAQNTKGDGKSGSSDQIVPYEPNVKTQSIEEAPARVTQTKKSVYQNIIKISLTDPGNSKYGLYYERYLKNGFSAEIGFGVTFRDHFASLAETALFKEDDARYQVGISNYFFLNREFETGQAYSFALRKYFGKNFGEQMTGFYLGIGFDRRHHYSRIRDSYWEDNDIEPTAFTFEREERTVTNITAHFGVQGYATPTITIESLCLIGYRHAQNSFMNNLEEDYNMSSTPQYVMQQRDFSGLAFMISTRLGLAF